jgi:NTP pyrophosphatase (non-canonical NTP hydrolase)
MLASRHHPYVPLSEPDKVLLHLVEEVGELARENRRVGSSFEGGKDNLANELADVVIMSALYAISIGVDLEDAVVRKLEQNEKVGKMR